MLHHISMATFEKCLTVGPIQLFVLLLLKSAMTR